MKLHKLTVVEPEGRYAHCNSCGEFIQLFPDDDSTEANDLRLATLEHRVNILMQAAENRHPSGRNW